MLRTPISPNVSANSWSTIGLPIMGALGSPAHVGKSVRDFPLGQLGFQAFRNLRSSATGSGYMWSEI